MAKRRKKLGALSVKQKVVIAGVGVPVLLLIGFGGFVLYRLIKSIRSRDAESELVEDQPVEVVVSTDPKCQKMEEKLNTPSGCGTVKVLGYRADTRNRTDYLREEVTISELPGFPGFYLQRAPNDAWSAFQRMTDAAKAAGIKLELSSAFRTMAKQKELYAKYLAGTGNLAALPGRSTHQYGVTVDIKVKGRPATLQWLRTNAGKYGFFETVKTENWHWEYIPAKDPSAAVA